MRVVEFKQFRKIAKYAELRPYVDGESMNDIDFGGQIPEVGDMIGRDPDNHKDQWLIKKDYFERNFEPM